MRKMWHLDRHAETLQNMPQETPLTRRGNNENRATVHAGLHRGSFHHSTGEDNLFFNNEIRERKRTTSPLLRQRTGCKNVIFGVQNDSSIYGGDGP